jgi:hypothetical protein
MPKGLETEARSGTASSCTRSHSGVLNNWLVGDRLRDGCLKCGRVRLKENETSRKHDDD